MTRRRVLIAVLLTPFIAIGLVALYLLVPDLPEEPDAIRTGSIQSGGRTRTFLYYVPAELRPGAMLLLALHGSMGSGQQMRGFTGYRLERLADRYGFVVAYPDGFEGHWNDCRANAPYSANAENIEDVAFVLDLVRYFLEAHQVTPRVYAAGFSNGGHMAFRLALEEPEVTGAIVALAANLPVPEGNNCSAQPGAVPVMIVNVLKIRSIRTMAGRSQSSVLEIAGTFFLLKIVRASLPNELECGANQSCPICRPSSRGPTKPSSIISVGRDPE